ncbi:3'-5' exoribonuclease YhaM family protein [Thermodesulfobacteriota bacterium]
MKKQYVSEIKGGDSIDDVFVITDKVLSQKKDGNNYLNVTLSDRTGHIKGVMWDNVDQVIASGLSAGDFVLVSGSVGEYRGNLQLVVKQMAACPADKLEFSDFLPQTRHSIDSMFERLVELTNAMESSHFKLLFRRFWEDEDFVRQFKNAPAAKNMHHAYIGGLLEHTLSMALLVERIAGHYSGVDMDLLLAGVILHDVGKTKEFEYGSRIDYSDKGRLLSHIVIGLELVEIKLQEIPDFPPEQALLLKHLIVSHHGSMEFGSPEPPKTIEAFLLNYIDEIDSKVNGIRDFISKEDPGESWSSYHRVLGRHFYLGEKKGDQTD